MRYLIILSLIVISTAAFAQPKIKILEGNDVNWGSVSHKDNPLSKEITIKNIGNETLEISEVKPSCGCTTAPLEKDKLEPGEETVLPIKLKISGNAGKVTKTIRVTSNDPENNQLLIRLNADVVRALVVDPTFIGFKDLQVGYETEGEVTIKNTSDEAITLWDFSVKPDNMKLNVEDKITIAPGENFVLKATVNPEGKGRFSSKITMKTSHSDFGELTIFGYGSAKPSPIFINN
jgi:hypothetical protein